MTENSSTEIFNISTKSKSVKYRNQFLASFIACLMIVSAGLTLGYTSPAFPDMNKPGRRFHLDSDDRSLFSSILNIGTLVGGLVAGFLIDYFGRKIVLIFMSVPYLIGWLTIVYAKAIWMLHFGRFVTGFSTGVNCLVVSVYITEISSSEIRGTLGSWTLLFGNTGFLLSYTVGAYVPWSYLALFSTIVPIIAMILMMFMPDTPVWLVRNGYSKEAKKSIEFLRGKDYDIESEVMDLTRAKHNEVKLSFSELRNPAIYKPLIIVELEMCFQQLNGMNAVLFNSVTIFSLAKSPLSSNIQSIIVAGVMIISSIVASFFMDRLGRRILYLLSSSIIFINLFTLGTFYYLQEHQPEIAAKVNWLPMLCLMLYVFMISIGMGPIPWISMSELFPANARGIASSLATATCSIASFVVTSSFEGLKATISMYGVFWLYGSITLTAFVFAWFFVPETKGKSIEEIQNIFKK